jgi:hypothetical protein
MMYDGIVGTFGQVEVVLRQLGPNPSLSGSIIYRDNVHGTFELGQTFLEDPPSRRCDRQTLPWWRSDYMGTSFASELIERWYSTRIFQFRERDYLIILSATVQISLDASPFGEASISSALIQHMEFSCCPYPDYFHEGRMRIHIVMVCGNCTTSAKVT